MSTNMIGAVRRARKIDPNGNIYYDRGVSDIIFDPERGTSVKEDIDKLRNGMITCLAFVAANPKGMDGKSAYEIALDHGFKGSEDDWIDSLKGIPGQDGLSAYEIAVVYFGFRGTMEDWLESLKGEKGDKGDDNYVIAVRNGYEGTEEEWINSMLNRALTDDEIQEIYNKIVNDGDYDLDDYEGLANSIKAINQKISTMDDALQQTIIDILFDNEESALTAIRTNGEEFKRELYDILTTEDIDKIIQDYIYSGGDPNATITDKDIDQIIDTYFRTTTATEASGGDSDMSDEIAAWKSGSYNGLSHVKNNESTEETPEESGSTEDIDAVLNELLTDGGDSQ